MLDFGFVSVSNELEKLSKQDSLVDSLAFRYVWPERFPRRSHDVVRE